MVTETPEIYSTHIRPYMLRQREEGRLNWVFNIIEGRTEQEDVILRDHGGTDGDGEGFLLLPDLNWDRKTMTSLHLLALVERRDIWSLRDLTKRHVAWLRRMRQHVLEATTKVYPGIEEDELKLYVHCKPLGVLSHALTCHDRLTFVQTNQHITTSTSTSCTPCLKLAGLRLLAKLWVSRTSSRSLKH
jgi:m7GpppX diphosphatase